MHNSEKGERSINVDYQCWCVVKRTWGEESGEFHLPVAVVSEAMC